MDGTSDIPGASSSALPSADAARLPAGSSSLPPSADAARLPGASNSPSEDAARIPAGSNSPPPSADAARLNEILQLGDRLLKLSMKEPLPYAPPLLKGPMLNRTIRQWTPEGNMAAAGKWLGVATAFAGVDVPHTLLRLPLAAAVWTLETLERSHYARESVCPYCFSPQSERYVYCQACERVQSSVRPAFGELWSRRCECGRAKFRLLGNYLSPRPESLVCHGGRSFSGCLRPLPVDVPWGRHPEVHVALAGPTRKKLIVLDRLWTGLTTAKNPQWNGKPCWDLTLREAAYLFAAIESGSELREGPVGKLGYALSRSGVFHVQSGRSERLLQFHNIATASLRSESVLAMQAMHLVHDDVLILVLDMDFADGKRPGLSPHPAIYTKLIRCAERLRQDIRSTDFWPRVAVVVPVDRGAEDIDSRTLSDVIRTRDPHLWGLLQYTTGDSIAYFGGALPAKPRSPRWIRRLLDYILGPHGANSAV